jgi:3,4-dihydroxy 2-butanone 4-phosphate synthase / GTP cyclohydrolase II
LNQPFETGQLEQALAALRAGRAIVICDDDDREGEGDLAFAASAASPVLVNTALSIARGLLCLSLRPADAARLGVEALASNRKDRFHTPFGMPLGLADGGSGISAEARAATLRKAADPLARPDDFAYPGHVATLLARAGGVLERNGHTEAIIDLLALAGIGGPGALCEVLMPDGRIAKRPFLERLGRERELPIVEIKTVERVMRLNRREASL